jgi:two-component system, response regulator PhcR
VVGEDNQQRNAEIGRAAGAMHDNAQYCLAVLSSFLQSVRSSAGGAKPKPGPGNDVSAGALVASLLDSYPFADNQRNWVQVELHDDFAVPTLPMWTTRRCALSWWLEIGRKSASRTTGPAFRRR